MKTTAGQALRFAASARAPMRQARCVGTALNDGAAVTASTSGDPGGRLPQRGQYRQPEPLRIPLIAPGRHPRDALRQPRRARLADPASQQHRLPAARAGTRDHRHG